MENKRRLNIFILGTPFCGSTLLTNCLNSHKDLFTAGELNRMPAFKQFAHLRMNDPEIYTDKCFLCNQRQQECPVWSHSFVNEICSGGINFSIYGILAQRTGKKGIVDSSKDPGWLSKMRQSSNFKPDQTFVIHVVRNPFAFAYSWKKKTGMPVWKGAEIWRDINIRAIMTANHDISLPYLVVRYEQFAVNTETELKRICSFLGIEFSEGMLKFWEVPIHSIGGNASAYLPYLKENESLNVPKKWHEGIRHHSGRKFGEHVDRRWIQGLNFHEKSEILKISGVSDTTTLLGYNLADILKEAFTA